MITSLLMAVDFLFHTPCVNKSYHNFMSHIKDLSEPNNRLVFVYWPNIHNDIDNIILACQQLQDCLPSNTKEPLIQKPTLCRPFQEMAMDLCSYVSHNYLVIVYCYTDWPAIISMEHDNTPLQLIIALRRTFCCTAIQDVLWSDAGHHFTSKIFHTNGALNTRYLPLIMKYRLQ